MRKLIVATGNPGKLKEMQDHLKELNLDLELILKPESIEIEETGFTFAENACLKASEVAKITGEWAIADDSGLCVDALDGAPGIFSARYGKTDEERIERLLFELGNELNRVAEFVSVVAIARPDGTIVYEAEGRCPGEILHKPRGKDGFGYDPIFYFPEKRLTFGEMKSDEKHKISHRARAFSNLIIQIENNNLFIS